MEKFESSIFGHKQNLVQRMQILVESHLVKTIKVKLEYFSNNKDNNNIGERGCE